MLEKVPATANNSSSLRPGGIPIQSTPTDENDRKKSGSCC